MAKTKIHLSPRQWQVICRRARGRSYKEIGAELGIARDTVGHHLRAVFKKTDEKSSAGAAHRLDGALVKRMARGC